jgi:hypothetical protein
MAKYKFVLGKNDAVLKRRERVAYYRAMSFTYSVIMEKLEEEGIINPKTQEPWSRDTIIKDMEVIRKMWKDECCQSVEIHREKQMANLDQVLSSAWQEFLRKQKNGENCTTELDLVNKTHDRISKLLGTNEPDKILNESDNDTVKIEIVHKTEEK